MPLQHHTHRDTLRQPPGKSPAQFPEVGQKSENRNQNKNAKQLRGGGEAPGRKRRERGHRVVLWAPRSRGELSVVGGTTVPCGAELGRGGTAPSLPPLPKEVGLETAWGGRQEGIRLSSGPHLLRLLLLGVDGRSAKVSAPPGSAIFPLPSACWRPPQPGLSRSGTPGRGRAGPDRARERRTRRRSARPQAKGARASGEEKRPARAKPKPGPPGKRGGGEALSIFEERKNKAGGIGVLFFFEAA